MVENKFQRQTNTTVAKNTFEAERIMRQSAIAGYKFDHARFEMSQRGKNTYGIRACAGIAWTCVESDDFTEA